MTKAEQALELAASLGLSKSEFAELAMLAIDQAGVPVDAQRAVLRGTLAERMDVQTWTRWREESIRWPR